MAAGIYEVYEFGAGPVGTILEKKDYIYFSVFGRNERDPGIFLIVFDQIYLGIFCTHRAREDCCQGLSATL